jgi:flagellar motor switch protein FliM
MRRETIKIGVEVDRETDAALRPWSKEEGRSKRRHVAVVLKNVARLRKLTTDELQRMPAGDVLRRLGLVP